MLHLFTCHERIMPRLAELLFIVLDEMHTVYFKQKVLIFFFLFLHKNPMFWYLLEVPH